MYVVPDFDEVPDDCRFHNVNGERIAAIAAEVSYLDDTMRIMRTSDGQMFVYGRMAWGSDAEGLVVHGRRPAYDIPGHLLAIMPRHYLGAKAW